MSQLKNVIVRNLLLTNVKLYMCRQDCKQVPDAGLAGYKK